MSAPITEAHRELAQSIAEAQRGYTEQPDEAAQLIADSEARACDQLRTEVERLGRATKNGQVNWMQESERQQARADRAEAEIKDRAAMMREVMRERDAAEAELVTEREKVRTLSLACQRIVAQWDADHDANPIGAGGQMYSLASKALAATEDAP